MDVTICGAAKIVTGSCYLIEVGDRKYLVECGMFQGTKDITRLNYEPFRFEPGEISHVFLTHSHIDHSGLIPKLVSEGFRGRVHATAATIDLCRIMLEDSAELQAQQTEHENKRRRREGLPPRQPLYSRDDVDDAMPLFQSVDYGVKYPIDDNITIIYRDAGHIMGSGVIEMFVSEGGETKKLVFSGDIGQWGTPVLREPTLIPEADYLFIESTYGDRLHEDISTREELLYKYTKSTYARGGKLMIPSFSVERTQEILYSFNKLIKTGRFPNLEIYLDSPLAIKAVEVFKMHREFLKPCSMEYGDFLSFPQLKYSMSTQDSKRLNNYGRPCVIIAGNGMCTGGRIRHHLRHGLWDPKNTLLFVGFQAEGTLGREILEGAESVHMMGENIAVKAEIGHINSYSSHADYEGLLKWAGGFTKKPKETFIIHGEEAPGISLKEKMEKIGFACANPEIGETLDL